MAQPPVISPPEMALFSTRNGKYAQRQAVPNMSIVIRSDPTEDCKVMTAKLLAEFPTICKSIITFVPKVGDYFDGYDQELQGFEFLRAVLLHISATNAAHARKVDDFVGRWMASNRGAFDLLTSAHGAEHLFTAEDRKDRKEEFLREATAQIKYLKDQDDRSSKYFCLKIEGFVDADNATIGATEALVRIEQERERMAAEHRNSISQSMAYGPHPVLQIPPVVSGPETNQGHLWPGSVRTIPPSHFPNQQGAYRQPQGGPPAGMLGHVNYGSARRPNIHTEHAQIPMGAFPSLNMDSSNVHMPSLGHLAAPVYGHQQPAPVVYPHRDHNNFQAKGKKNPVKRSSDDARKSSFEVGNKYQAYGRRRSSQFDNSQIVQSPQSMFTPMQPPGDSSRSLFYPSDRTSVSSYDRQQQPKMIEHGPANMQPFVSSSEDHPQTTEPVDFTNETPTGRTERVGFQTVPPTMAAHPPDPGLPDRHISDMSHDASTEKNIASTASQTAESTHQSLDPHAFGHQLPNVQIGFPNARSKAPEAEAPTRHYTPGQGQIQDQQTLQRSKKQWSPRKTDERIKGLRIFIGGLPNQIDKYTVRQMLEPCRGLIDITPPKTGVRNTTHVFAKYVLKISLPELVILMMLFVASIPTMRLKRLWDAYLKLTFPIYRKAELSSRDGPLSNP